ncbi:hypothetical protein [Sporolituus thermophilus]|uniref:Uncharacterized protein n=1 Tax=Sporolituus thermophilus DSM 23256 TaxID=1123285 RepID=A0A1G7K318_9FIRM|nr:hypothetical protein [Sporolituus thermophilus]SDF31623.1 hypothetical protein SAMN05660235_01153 [Sporolituus thermophilus DSM 23256]
MDKDIRKLTKEEKEAIFCKAVQEEIKKHHAAGRPTTHADKRGIYRLYPDGHKEYLDDRLDR